MKKEAHARKTDPATSHEAARSLTPDNLRDVQKRVFGLFKTYGPMTDDTMIKHYKTHYSQVSDSTPRTRRQELVTAGLLEDSGEKLTMASGLSAIVWRIKVKVAEPVPA